MLALVVDLCFSERAPVQIGQRSAYRAQFTRGIGGISQCVGFRGREPLPGILALTT